MHPCSVNVKGTQLCRVGMSSAFCCCWLLQVIKMLHMCSCTMEMAAMLSLSVLWLAICLNAYHTACYAR